MATPFRSSASDRINGSILSLAGNHHYNIFSNRSDATPFRTITGLAEQPTYSMRMHAAEVVLIILIVAAWAGAVALFLNRWGRIRIVQQRDFNYRHKPKNLDQVKIVKRPTESVIYRTYSTSMANTIEAREKRLERMRTMPNIKIAGGSAAALPSGNGTSAAAGGGGGGGGGDGGADSSVCVPLLEIQEEQPHEHVVDSSSAVVVDMTNVSTVAT